jgi:hypothetical protein
VAAGSGTNAKVNGRDPNQDARAVAPGAFVFGGFGQAFLIDTESCEAST